jgi:hypothetical protein
MSSVRDLVMAIRGMPPMQRAVVHLFYSETETRKRGVLMNEFDRAIRQSQSA